MPHSKKPNVLVTGASSGVGVRCAHHLDASGYEVFELGRPGLGRPNAPGSEVQGRAGRFSQAFDQEQITAFVLEKIWNRHGPVHAIANCLDYGLLGPIEETTLQEAQTLFQANALDMISVCRAVLPLMRQRGDGLIVNVGLEKEAVPRAYHGVYRASRSAMESLTDALREEVAPFGVDVTLVRASDAPGSRGHQRAGMPVARHARERSAYGERFEHARTGGNTQQESQPAADARQFPEAEAPCSTALLIERLIRRTQSVPAAEEEDSAESAKRRRPGSLFQEVRTGRPRPDQKEEPPASSSQPGTSLSASFITFAGVWDERSKEEVREAITSLERSRVKQTGQPRPKGWTCTARPPAEQQRGAYTAHRHESQTCFCAQTSRELATLVSERRRSCQPGQLYTVGRPAAPANPQAVAR